MKIKKLNELNQSKMNLYIKNYSCELEDLICEKNPYNDDENFIIFIVKAYSGGDSLDLVEEILSKEFKYMGYEIDDIYEEETALKFHVKLKENDILSLFYNRLDDY